MKIADIGNTIQFKREDCHVDGIVKKVLENSVIVEVDETTMEKLSLPNNKTIVNHKNYKIK